MRRALAFLGLLALALAGYGWATHESVTELHVVPGTTVVVPDRTVTDADPLPHTVTETVYVTVTAPPPAPPPSPPPPPSGPGTTLTVNGRWVCNRALSAYGPLPITVEQTISNAASAALSANGAVELQSACAGDGTPATDLILHVNGNGTDVGSASDGIVLKGAHDIELEGWVNCGRPQGGAHQDGVQMNSAHRLTFRNFTSGNVVASQPANWIPTCHGAGAIFYVSELNDVDANLTGVVCEGCRMAGSTVGEFGTGLGIYGSTDSGARNSTFAAHRPCVVSTNPRNAPTRPVNVGNTCVDTG